MFDFRLKVFRTVANRLNFTKAAEELFITQPAVTKHIKELENHFKTPLFDRNGTKINLTPAGKSLLQYVDQVFSVYNQMETEIGTFSQRTSGILRIGASTTASQYLLPPILADFHSKFKDVKLQLSTANSEHIAASLQNGAIDLGIIEGNSKNPNFQYTLFKKDELVLVAQKNHPIAAKNAIRPTDLHKYSFLMREPGSGTLEVIAHALKTVNVSIADLPIEMQMDNSESIKSYLLNAEALAFLSIFAVLKEFRNNQCSIIDVKGLTIEREFNFIQPQGNTDPLAQLFMKFAINHNLK